MMAAETVADVLAGPNLATCSGPYWAAYARGYAYGCLRGYETHRAEVEAAEAETWAVAVRNVQAAARRASYATLCDRRGEPYRAARAGLHERRLGLTP